MNLDPDRRLALHSLSLSLAAGGLIMVFPAHTEIGWGLLVLGAFLSIYTERVRIRLLLAGFERALPRRYSSSALRRPDAAAFVPLAQVAQELVDVDPGSKMMEHARIGDPSPSEILNWFGIWIIQRGLPIYGHRLPATTFESISAEDLKSGMVDDGARVLRWHGADHLTFHDLAVKQNDLKARRADLVAAVTDGKPS